jgi:hypothetical protein
LKTKLTKAALGLAITAVVGAGAIGANGLFVANALAANNDQKAPMITADVAPVNVGAETGLAAKYAATVVVDDSGNQTIVWDESLSAEDRARLEKDLETRGSTKDSLNSTFIAGTPSENDLTEEQAVDLAKNSVDSDFALTEETWAKFSIDAKLNVVDLKAPVWSVTFYPTDQNDFSQIGTYNVTIDSHSSDIIKIMSAADGVG